MKGVIHPRCGLLREISSPGEALAGTRTAGVVRGDARMPAIRTRELIQTAAIEDEGTELICSCRVAADHLRKVATFLDGKADRLVARRNRRLGRDPLA